MRDIIHRTPFESENEKICRHHFVKHLHPTYSSTEYLYITSNLYQTDSIIHIAYDDDRRKSTHRSSGPPRCIRGAPTVLGGCWLQNSSGALHVLGPTTEMMFAEFVESRRHPLMSYRAARLFS